MNENVFGTVQRQTEINKQLENQIKFPTVVQNSDQVNFFLLTIEEETESFKLWLDGTIIS
jgi:hypothetical protein